MVDVDTFLTILYVMADEALVQCDGNVFAF